MSTTCDYYLSDVLRELLERARAAHVSARDQAKLRDASAMDFESGRAMGYYEVVSYMVQQLDAFQLPRERYHIPPSFDADELLNG